ncbi:cytochrome b/b6 domain-containing protein [Bordetella genomosp. 13]|uniref:cytochrome b/b6 domain-containing protein n=1 Tax=Bordetella genomosp. 13 TaxID=463040 RepID=UPI0011A1DBD4|nr:cytochrome b/b6 domain-containing protein [Bordetella genomosp. 13]
MPYSRLSVRIWDVPTRLFHWALAACVIGAYVCVKLGGLYMDWHVRLGLAALGLVMFRIVWGFIGPRHARFANFVRGPRAVLAYLRGGAVKGGHNPLGALSVLAMLLAFGVQAASGLFVTDDIMVQGPLYGRVDESASSFLAWLHHSNEWIMIALVALHVAAIAWYALVRRQRLVRAMITGDMPAGQLADDAQPSEDGPAVWLRGLVLALCVAGLVWWIQSLETAASMSY